jgi:hypothetical protein
VTVSGICSNQTEFTTSFLIDAANFNAGSPGTSREAIYTIDNIGLAPNNTPLTFTISIPFTRFSSLVPVISGQVTIFNTLVNTNNGDWNIVPINISPFGIVAYECTLKPGVVIAVNQSSIITLTLTALNNVGQGQTTGQIQSSSGGDQNPNNNYSQGSLNINN